MSILHSLQSKTLSHQTICTDQKPNFRSVSTRVFPTQSLKLCKCFTSKSGCTRTHAPVSSLESCHSKTSDTKLSHIGTDSHFMSLLVCPPTVPPANLRLDLLASYCATANPYVVTSDITFTALGQLYNVTVQQLLTVNKHLSTLGPDANLEMDEYVFIPPCSAGVPPPPVPTSKCGYDYYVEFTGDGSVSLPSTHNVTAAPANASSSLKSRRRQLLQTSSRWWFGSEQEGFKGRKSTARVSNPIWYCTCDVQTSRSTTIWGQIYHYAGRVGMGGVGKCFVFPHTT